jgi:imidazolonepropionase-like amidohydrolase
MHAIRAAHAFDGTRFLPGGATVLVDDDQIAGVHSGGRVELPDGVEVTEYEGTVLPGLFDCHTHLVADSTFGGLERAGTLTDEAIDLVIVESLQAHAAAGVTTVRDLGDRGYHTLAFRTCPGLPRVVASGPPLTTPGGHCHFLGGAVPGDLRAAVAEHADRGVDVVKVMASGGFATRDTDQLGAQFTVPELAALVDAAHRADLPIVAHAHSLLGMQNALAAGVDGIEHFTGLSSAGGAQIEPPSHYRHILVSRCAPAAAIPFPRPTHPWDKPVVNHASHMAIGAQVVVAPPFVPVGLITASLGAPTHHCAFASGSGWRVHVVPA